MATVLLVRHGRTAANAGGVLAGRQPGIDLDERGREQVAALVARLAPIPLQAVVSSPLERCVQTAQPLLAGRDPVPPLHYDQGLSECAYGDWTGQRLAVLAKDPLWKVVQAHPSAVRFPGETGESMLGMAQRAVDAVRRWNAALGADACWVAVSHGDVIKAIVADALGMHLDAFQRITVDNGSVTAIQYTDLRPFVLHLNDTGSDLAGLLRPPTRSRRRRRASDAAVGGG
ncbi:MAG: MSMEG_4193 family putative phosphomutase [Actinomycetota bacterium]|nr:MAG: MSMEG_4193 family putative phosphomutase [Actinomycetota bacterium]